MKPLLFICLLILALSCQNQPVVVLQDDFSQMKTGQVSVDVGAHIEYHYLPEAAPQGNWEVSVFRSIEGFRTAWKVIEDNNKKYLYQGYDTKESKQAQRFHPMVCTTKDALWEDYNASVTLIPEGIHDETGFAFRYVHDRNCYLLAFDKGNSVRVKKVYDCDKGLDPCEDIIGEAPFSYSENQVITASVELKANLIKVIIMDGPTFELNDDSYPKGKIALFADVPTKFSSVTVKMNKKAFDQFTAEAKIRDDEEKTLQTANPKPVLWKKINTKGFGVGRNLRFGDLNNDGVKDVLVAQVIEHGPRNSYDETGCLTAMTFDGDILWRVGEPNPDNWVLLNDVGVQIHDFNNDGKNEVIYASNFEIVVLNGETGKLIKKIPTPKTNRKDDQYDRILGDCLFFCDVSGNGYDGDLLIKDRYWNFWIYDKNLKLKWTASTVTGHYPFAYDTDKDGKDEILMGYSLFDDDGTLLWDKKFTDHGDGVAVFKFQENSEPVILNAASDEGMIFLKTDGTVIKKHNLGHVQNPAVANFRDDLPGLEVVSINFWGNQGIIHFYDSNMNVYKTFEPNQFGSMCLPINWTGKTEEFFVHNANIIVGGMYDGWGRKVVVFPDDGHPDMANSVLDLTGDCREEIVVWDQNQIWVYTQDDSPKQGDLYKPVRNPLYNNSNYQASLSLPYNE